NYVLDGFLRGAADRLAAASLTPVLCTLPQVQAAVAWAAAHGPLKAALQVDTGMNRQGLSLAEARALTQAPLGLRGLDLGLLVSHLGSASEADEPRNARQREAFEEARRLFPECRTSLAASAGVYLGEA